MTFSNDDPKRAKKRGFVLVGVLVGVLALYFAGSWAKQRSVDSDRIFVGVHALNGKEAIVMLRDDEGEQDPSWRIERIRFGRDEPLWGYSIRNPYVPQVGNGMSVAAGQSVILDELGAIQVGVTALDLDTGESTWKRPFGKRDGYPATIVGGDRFVLVDGGDRVHVLDRATGKTLYEREEGQMKFGDYAFTETWIEFLTSSEVEYLELETGRVRRIEDPRGAHCRVGGHVYGFDHKGTLRSRDLATDESAEVLPLETRLPKFFGDSCGWQNTSDGSLRLLFAAEMPGLLVAVDLDPASPAGSGRVAWTHTFAASIETGGISYRVPNRLDLVWSGEVPRFAPLEIDMPSPNVDDSKIVVVDTHDGTLSRQGPPGARSARRFSSFKRGKTVFMVLKGRRGETPGTVLAMDTLTGETHAVSSPGQFRIVPPSVTDTVVWAWTDPVFSREGNLAITVLDQELQVLETSNPERAPTADEDAVTSLLGPDSG